MGNSEVGRRRPKTETLAGRARSGVEDRQRILFRTDSRCIAQSLHQPSVYHAAARTEK